MAPHSLCYHFCVVVVLLLCVHIVQFSDALTKMDPGVCHEVVHKEDCKQKPCIELVCCKGWVYKNNTCVPQCKFGCVGGECVKPNKCQCKPPLVLKGRRECVMPKCDPPCVNATCDISGKCTCLENFYPVNKSHCELCTAGHYIDQKTLQCKPICKSPCKNGTCTGPDQCTCSPGYKYKDKYECVPDCSPACRNGVCVEPGKCTCPTGFRLENGWKCTPICDSCANGDCVAPQTCECHQGYSKNSADVCSPDCRDCISGFCSKPNQCECHEGYLKKDGKKCAPVCKNKCLNGYCSEPDVCACLEGFLLVNHTCVAICEPSCVNATCILPNKCQCLLGYESSSIAESICHPKCDSCEHGECIAPNNCKCHHGYNKTNGVCVPVCSNACKNSFCSYPDTCTCNDGYQMNSTSPYQCIKPCTSPCNDGKCDEDGNCVCKDGFELRNDTCSPVPMQNCKVCRGKCKNDEECRCPDGRPCAFPPTSESEVRSNLSLAGLQISWLVAAAITLLLFTLVLVVLRRVWNRRQKQSNQDADSEKNFNGSVVYTVPNTLLKSDVWGEKDRNLEENDYVEVFNKERDLEQNESLLKTESDYRRDF